MFSVQFIEELHLKSVVWKDNKYVFIKKIYYLLIVLLIIIKRELAEWFIATSLKLVMDSSIMGSNPIFSVLS